jgi:hypothetical protein
MGMLMKTDDSYIPALLEMLNLYFGTFPDEIDAADETHKLTDPEKQMRLGVNGIREIQAIQTEFELFKVSRPLVQSLRALGVGGLWNNAVKKKWYKLLSRLDDYPSNVGQLTGGVAIVTTLVDHLKTTELDPDPVYFMAHNSETQAGGGRVLITPAQRPIFYIQRNFLVISLPMKARPLTA